MTSTLTTLIVLQLVALACCSTSADVKAADKTEDDQLKVINDNNNNEDLDTQETGWMMDPIQMKLKELENIKYKVFSPFMTLKAPSQFYGGGYPIYSSGGSTGFSSGLTHHASVSAPSFSWGKPVKTVVPSYYQNTWYKKGTSGVKYQPIAPSYAPDCDYTITSKPLPVYVPSKPTYSSGMPLNVYYSSVDPSLTYGTPSVGFSTKASFSSSSQAAPLQPALQGVSTPVVTSTAFIVKSSPQYSFLGYQPADSTTSGYKPFGSLPSSQSVQPSWSGLSGYYPSSASLTQGPAAVPSPPSFSGVSGYNPSSVSLPQAPSWSGVPGYFPFSSALPQAPASSSSSGISNYYPLSAGSPQIPSTPAPPTWSSVTGSFPSSTPSPPSWSSYSVLIPSAPAPAQLSDQGVSITSEEVSVTPPPVGAKSNIVSNVQGPSIALSQEQVPYNPGSAYAVPFYPNVFYISNEQHIDQQSTEIPDIARSSLISSPAAASTAVLSENTSTSTATESSTASTNTQTIPLTFKSPLQTTFYSSNSADQTKVPLAYSLQQPIFPPTRAGFIPSPLLQNIYPVPVTNVVGTASLGIAQPQVLQTVPFTRSSINTYPISLGYSYQPPPVAFQTGLQAFASSKSLPPC